MPQLREVDQLLWPAVQETLAALGKLSEDSAARKLVQRYAQVIDATPDAKQASVLRWLGPEMLRLLESLGATPAARAAISKGIKSDAGADKPKSELDKMREARAHRGRA